MATVRVDVDKGDVERMIEDAVDAVSPPNITDAVKDAARVFQRGVARRAPRKTGRLANSFTVSQVSATECEVSSDLVYAHVQEFGAYIRPRRRGGRLRFTAGGGVRFAKAVRIRPQPYFVPTFHADAGDAFEAFADRVEDAIQSG